MSDPWFGLTILVTLVTCVWGQGVDRQYKCDWVLDLVNRGQGIITRYLTPDTTIHEDITALISNVDLTPDDSQVVI